MIITECSLSNVALVDLSMAFISLWRRHLCGRCLCVCLSLLIWGRDQPFWWSQGFNSFKQGWNQSRGFIVRIPTWSDFSTKYFRWETLWGQLSHFNKDHFKYGGRFWVTKSLKKVLKQVNLLKKVLKKVKFYFKKYSKSKFTPKSKSYSKKSSKKLIYSKKCSKK